MEKVKKLAESKEELRVMQTIKRIMLQVPPHRRSHIVQLMIEKYGKK